ncbi:MAG: hypothetical protein A2W25_11765 [candidate division Zixibacteria bacterium RBG_16_53_22]|nr:MAG: hypothetical protein A2W25_11765 [candidate division Zixibacteria bacterium RBG_16_53_22]
MVDVIYDFDPKEGRKIPEFILYEDRPVVPVEERKNPFITGDLEEMVVGAEYVLTQEQLSPQTMPLLTRLRGIFREGGLLSYQDIMQAARQHGLFRCPPDYPHKAWPPLTRHLNQLWRAGLIKKYRRGLWWGAVVCHTTTGRNHGVCFWIW